VLAYEFHNQVGGFNVAHDLFVQASGPSGVGGVRLTWHRLSPCFSKNSQ
jgi:hypothetical protein